MLSLVAYGNSSDSEDDESQESDSNVQVNDKLHAVNGTKISETNNEPVPLYLNGLPSGNLFTQLPQPRINNKKIIEEEQDEFLLKKENCVEKPPKLIRINVPSLTEFDSDDDDDEPAVKRSKQQVKASGLFALLPAPKVTPLSNTSFVPNVLQKKTTKPPSKPSVKTPSKNNATARKSTVTSTNGISNGFSNGISNGSLKDDSDSHDEDMEVPETFDDETWQKVCGKKNRIAVPTRQKTSRVQEPVHIVEAAPEVSKPYSGLDNQAFKELVGSRKGVKENINLIDIHEDEIHPDKSDWLKSLTDPNFEPETAIEEPVNNTCRVKNHITALAQKALANDKELQMRWAESRHNRKQTQAKYGF